MSNSYALEATQHIHAVKAARGHLEVLLEAPAGHRDNAQIAALNNDMNLGARLGEVYALLAIADALATREKMAAGPAGYLSGAVGGTLAERLERADLDPEVTTVRAPHWRIVAQREAEGRCVPCGAPVAAGACSSCGVSA